MSRSRWLVIGVFFLLIILFVGLLFWPFILNGIIAPTSQVVWILLRIFVLSIDQKYYWVAIIFITSFFLYRRLPPLPPPAIQSEDFHSNATMRTLGYWLSLFNLMDQHVQDDEILKKELADLLVSLYATKQHTLADFRLHDALQQGKIPLPEQIRAFLFLEEPQQVGRSFKKLVQSIGNTPRKWIRRWTGQEKAEHYHMVDEILCFMETSLEMKNDDGTFKPHQH